MKKPSRVHLGSWDPKNLLKYENIKMYFLTNPDGAMRSIMYVLDDFAGFWSFPVHFVRIFKNGLEN